MKLIPIQMAISALALSGAAFAQTAAPAAPVSPLSFNISVTSNYKFRGQDQDTFRTRAVKPALQGGLDYAFANGFYLGNWNSTTSFQDAANGGRRVNLEVDLYGGYKWNYGDLGFDVGALQYVYVDSNHANTTELYLGASYGPVSAKYSTTVSRGYFGTGYATRDGRGTGYFNIAFAKEVAANLTFKAAIGRTDFRGAINNAGTPDFTDYSIGASYDLGSGYSLAGYIQGASQKNNANFQYTANGSTASLNRSVLLFTLTKAL